MAGVGLLELAGAHVSEGGVYPVSVVELIPR